MHKPLCPLCGKELQIRGGPEDWKPTFYDPDSGGDPYHANCECGFFFSSGTYEYENFITALNRRAQPENKPLTLDELRQMDGQPVWVQESPPYTFAGYKVLSEHVTDVRDNTCLYICFTDEDCYAADMYGKTWLAYRSKPKEEV